MLSLNSLVACLAEIDRYIDLVGWDQPGRLFALVPTVELAAAVPDLLDEVGAWDQTSDHLFGIEQDGFEIDGHLSARLAELAWTEEVVGCALAVERTLWTVEYEGQLPAEPARVGEFEVMHPERQGLWIVAGALRDGRGHCLARSGRHPGQLLSSPHLAPGLVEALAATLV
jgi:hypothetical protein